MTPPTAARPIPRLRPRHRGTQDLADASPFSVTTRPVPPIVLGDVRAHRRLPVRAPLGEVEPSSRQAALTARASPPGRGLYKVRAPSIRRGRLSRHCRHPWVICTGYYSPKPQPHERSDRRSVGELLPSMRPHVAPTPPRPRQSGRRRHGPGMGRAVQAGHEFLAASSRSGHYTSARTGRRPDPGRPDCVSISSLMASALNDNLRPRPWPGDGPADERLLALTGNLVRAHDLLVRGLRTSTPPSPAVQADAAAARTRVLHTLYVTAHGLSLAAVAESRALESNSRSMQRRSSIHKLSAQQSRRASTPSNRWPKPRSTDPFRQRWTASISATSAPDRLRDALRRRMGESRRIEPGRRPVARRHGRRRPAFVGHDR